MSISGTEILDLLPHRFPFLFVDRVVSWEANARIHAQKLTSHSDPILQGHFPGNPILPGVVQVEAMAQTAVILARLSGGFDPATQDCLFMGIQEAKFRAPVRPGQVLDIHVEALRVGRIGKFSGKITCDGATLSSAKFTAIIQTKPAPKATTMPDMPDTPDTPDTPPPVKG